MASLLRRSSKVAPFARATFLSALLVGSASAHTWIVGPGAGSDFPTITAAIAGAQAGDVLLVRSAGYSGGFTLDKGLTILGTGPVSVLGQAIVTGIPSGQRAVLVQLSVDGLEIDGCVGPVILQDLSSSVPATVSASSDVRILRATIHIVYPSDVAASALTVSQARVEVVDSLLQGVAGAFSGVQAMSGLRCADGSRVHVARADIVGGKGYDVGGPWWYPAGNGASAIEASPGAELILAGGGRGTAVAGDPGINWGGSCCQDGEGFTAVSNAGVNPATSLRYSGVELRPSYWHEQSGSPSDPSCCDQFDYPGIEGPATAAVPDDPTLTISGTPTNGGTVTLTITGPVGASAFLEIGRRPVVAPDPYSAIEELVDPISTVDLGTIPASGTASYVFGIPGFARTNRYLHLPPGALFVAQGYVAFPTGGMQRTNSIPIVGR